MFLSRITSRKTDRHVWRFAPIGIALLLAACAGTSRLPKATEKSTPVRIPLQRLADVVGTYRNYAGLGAAFDGVVPAAMRIFPDGSANWTTVKWVSYADYTSDGMRAIGPYAEPTRYARKLEVRDGMLCAQDGGATPLFVAYEVDASALEKRNGGYTPNLPAPSLPPADRRRVGPVMIFVPFENHQQFESKGESFYEYDFNLFERWRDGPPVNAVPIPVPQPELLVEGNGLGRLSLEASDADEDDITFILVDRPVHGTLTLAKENPLQKIYLYHPVSGYRGADRLSFKVSDGRGTSAPCELKIQVLGSPR